MSQIRGLHFFFIIIAFLVINSQTAKRETEENLDGNVIRKIFSGKKAEFMKKEETLEPKQLKLYFSKAHKQLENVSKILDYTKSALPTSGDKLLLAFLEYFDGFIPVNEFNFEDIIDNDNLLSEFSTYIQNSMNWYTFLDDLKEKLVTPRILSKQPITSLLNNYDKNTCSAKALPVSHLAQSINHNFNCKFNTFDLEFRKVDNLEVEKVKEDAYCEIINEAFEDNLKIECFYGKQTISGKFIHLNEVIKNQTCHGDIKIMEIFAERKVFISESVTFFNIKQINIISPVIEIVEKVKCDNEIKLKCDIDPNTRIFRDDFDEYVYDYDIDMSKNCITERSVLKIKERINGVEDLTFHGGFIYIITGYIKNYNMLSVEVFGKLLREIGAVKVIELSKEYTKWDIEKNYALAQTQSMLGAFLLYTKELEKIKMFDNIQISLYYYKKYIVTQLTNKGKLEAELFDFYENITKHSIVVGYNEFALMEQEFEMLKNSFFHYVYKSAESPEDWKLDTWIFLFNNLMDRVKVENETDESKKLNLLARLTCTLYILKYEILQDKRKSKIEELTNFEKIIVSNDITFLKENMLDNKETIKKASNDARYILSKTIDIINRMHTELTSIIKKPTSTNGDVRKFVNESVNVMKNGKAKIDIFNEAVKSVFQFSLTIDQIHERENELPIKKRSKQTNRLNHEIVRSQLATMNRILLEIKRRGRVGQSLHKLTNKITYMILLWKYYLRSGEYPDNNTFHSLKKDLLDIRKHATAENKSVIAIILDIFKKDNFNKKKAKRISTVTLTEKDLHKSYFQNIAVSFKMVVQDIVQRLRDLFKSNFNYFKYSLKSETVFLELFKNLTESSSSFFTVRNISLIVQKYLDQEMVVRYSEASRIKSQVPHSDLFETCKNDKFQSDCNATFDLYKKAAENLIMFIFPFAEYYVSDVEIIDFLHNKLSFEEVTNITNYKIDDIGDKFKQNIHYIIANAIKSSKDYFFAYISVNKPFYVWRNSSYSESLKQLLSGKETTFKADISKGLNLNAIKFKRVSFTLKVIDNNMEENFQNIFNNFQVNIKHSEDNFYRCNARTYLIKSSSISWTMNVKEYYLFDETGKKLNYGDAVLSPYTTWTIQLIAMNSSFASAIKKYQGQVDLYLEGTGYSLKKNSPFCNQILQKNYKLQL